MPDPREPLLAYLEKPSRRRFARVVRMYQDRVWAVARRVAGNDEDAADITQDVFLELLDAAPPAGNVRSPRGYLAWRVITRASRTRRSAERRRAREAENLRRASAAGEAGLEAAEALRAALAELPEELRIPVELRYFSGLRNAEIAELVGLPLRTLESRLAEARESLRRKLAPLVLSALLAGPDAPGGAAPAALRARLARVASWGAALSTESGARTAALAGGAIVAGKGSVVLAALVALVLGGYAMTLRESGESIPAAPADLVSPAPPDAAAGAEAPTPVEDARAAERPPSPETARLTGAVRDEDGQPIAGARVRFYDNISEEHAALLRSMGHESAVAGELKRDTASGPDGEFAFEGLFPGEARVGAKASGFLNQGQPDFELVAGKETRQDLVLRSPRRLTGSVRDGAGIPVMGAAVLVRWLSVSDPDELEVVGLENNRFVAF